jgi:hypothetical protein
MIRFVSMRADLPKSVGVQGFSMKSIDQIRYEQIADCSGGGGCGYRKNRP